MKTKYLFFIYLVILLIPQVDVCVTERVIWMGKVVMIVLPLAFYWTFLLLFNKPSKAFLWAFPFAFLGAFQIVLGYLYGRGVIGVDMWLTLTTTSPGEAGEMLTQIYPSVLAVCVIYLPSIGYAIWHVRKEQPYGRLFRTRAAVAGGVMWIAAFVPTLTTLRDERYSFYDDFFPVNVCYNLHLALERAKYSVEYSERTASFRFGVRESDTIPEVVVMVVGETSRATDWSLFGYERETSPRLSEEKNLLKFRDCMSQSNTTHKSVPIILSPASAEDYDTLYSVKGILAAAREAGWKTVFISNEPRNHSFNDFLGEQAEEVRFQRDSLGGAPMDALLIPLLADAVKRHERERLFMVIHTYGSHPTYSDRYTREEAFFKPDVIVKPTAENRPVVINAYDNAIRMTDNVLASFISVLKQCSKPAVMFYVSDHGEDLFDDDRKLYMHASPYPSYYQLHVPLLCWTNNEYGEQYGERVSLMASRQNEPLQTDCVFPTLLSLMGIECDYNARYLSIADSGYKRKAQRTYLDDHNKTRRLEDMLEQEDIVEMRRRGMYVKE